MTDFAALGEASRTSSFAFASVGKVQLPGTGLYLGQNEALKTNTYFKRMGPVPW